MNVLSLFSGIGGIDLGLERAGMTIVGQVEIDAFCLRILARHWPDVPRHDDVYTFPSWWKKEKRPDVHVVAAGFPCQPFSLAGAKLGRDDQRYLWPAALRALRTLRPSYVLLENVPGILRTDLGTFLGDLAALGYDAEWESIPASAVGAPHRRDRVFAVAYRAEVADAYRRGRDRRAGTLRSTGRDEPSYRGGWPAEPGVARVAHGVPRAVDRIRSLGNAVVPQVAEYLGRAIIAADRG